MNILAYPMRWLALLCWFCLLVQATPASAQAPDPRAPGNVKAVGGDQRITVSWDQPTQLPSGASIYYEIQINDGFGWKDAGISIPLSETITRFGGYGSGDRITFYDGTSGRYKLENGREYTVRVRYSSVVGKGPWAEVKVTPMGDDKLHPRPTLTMPVGSHLAARRAINLTVTFDEPVTGLALDDFVLSANARGAGWSVGSLTGSGAVYTVTLNLGTAINSPITIQVRRDAAKDAAGKNSIESDLLSIPVLGIPDAPTDITVTPGDGMYTVSWKAPTNTGGSPIIRYEYSSQPGYWFSTGSGNSWTVNNVLNNLLYFFYLRAVNAQGGGEPSALIRARPTAAPATVPNAPTNLTAIPDDTTVKLDWDVPADNGGSAIIRYEVSRDNGNWSSTSSTDSSFNVTGLTNETPYTFRVRAVNAVGNSAASSSVSATPAIVPDAPTNLGAVPAGDSEIALNWTAPANNGGSAITDYEYSTDGGTTWTSTGGTSVSYTVTGLNNRQQYSFAVRAVNAIGNSAASTSVSATPMAVLTVPDSPTGLTATAGNAEVKLDWQAPLDNGGSAITKYQYLQQGGGAGGGFFGGFLDDWIDIPDSGVGGANENSFTVTNLIGNTQYTFEVRAVNAQGVSGASNQVSSTPNLAMPPNTPRGLMAQPGDAQVKLIWQAPVDNGIAVTDYEYQVDQGGWASTGSTDTSVNVGGLTNAQKYTFRVRAVNAQGVSGASNLIESTPTATTPPAAPTGLTATAGNTEIKLDWDNPGPGDDGGSPIIRYEVSSDGGTNWTSTSSTDSSFNVTGLDVIQYTFSVRAVNAVGNSAASSSVSATPITTPNAPGNPMTTPGDTQIRLDWAAPGSDGGSPITSYQYQQEEKKKDDQQAVNVKFGDWKDIPGSDVTTRTYTVTGLTNGERYHFRVRAINSQGAGPATLFSAVVGLSIPDTPDALVATAGDTEVTLRWNTPLDDGGSAITGYEYQQKTGDNAFGLWTSIAGSGADTKSYTVAGLTNGTRYAFKIRAVNGIGNSLASAEAAATPMAPAAPDIHIPDAPGNLVAVAGNTEATLRWNTPLDDGGSAITGYQYRQKIGDNAFGAWTGIAGSNVATRTYTVTGLTNGTRYTYEVRAVNVAGSGAESNPIEVSPRAVAVAPGAPGNLVAVAGNTEVTLRWDAPPDDGGSAITGYEYRQQAGANAFGVWLLVPGSDVNTRSYTVTSLTNKTQYTFEVRAVNVVGVGTSARVSSTPDLIVAPLRVPDAPGNLNVVVGNQSATLSWDAPVNDGGSAITRYEYRQQAGVNAFGAWQPIATSGAGQANESDFTVTGLNNGTGYTFEVRAVNAQGQSMPSNQASGTPDARATVPDAPTITSAAPGDAQIVLTWTAPGSDGGSAITGYAYRQKIGTGVFGAWTNIPGSDVNTRSYTVTGLANGIAHTFEVRAINAQGASTPSNQVSNTPVGVSDAPSNLIVELGNTTLTLRWHSPASDGGSPITGYQYRQQAGANAFGAWQAIATSAPGQVNERQFIVSGLTNGTGYTFEVRAVNAVGPGMSSNQASGTPRAAVASAPRNLTAVPGDAQVKLNWDVPANNGGSAITDYEYQIGSDPWVGTGSTDTSVNVGGLNNGTQYSFKVRAVNMAGNGAESSSVSAEPAALVAPGAPNNFSATAGDARVVLRWLPPTNNGGSPVTGYEYLQQSDGGFGGGDWQAIANSGAGEVNAASYTVSGLMNGTRYIFQVRAVSNVGKGTASSQINATPMAAIVAPDAPTNLGAVAGDAQVILSWQAPVNNGGSPITSYQYRIDGSGAWIAIINSGVGGVHENSFTVTGLNNNTQYSFEVRAVNAQGLSVASNSTPGVTPMAVVTVPDAPTNLRAVAGNTQIVLNWDAPVNNGGSPITGYEYRQRAAAALNFGAWQAIADSAPGGANDNSFTVTSLTNGTRYTFQVRAVNGAGDSTASNLASTTPIIPDTTAPTVTITTDAEDGSHNGQVFTATFSFSEGVIGFVLNEIKVTGGNASNFIEISARVYTATITPTDAYTNIEIDVDANTAQDGVKNGNTAARQLIIPHAAPIAPRNLQAQAGDRQVTLSWQAPARAGSSAITGYEYRQQEGANVFGAWQAIADSAPGGANDNSFTVTGLANGTRYTFQVRAVNSAGDGAASGSASEMPVDNVAPMVTITTNAVGGSHNGQAFTATFSFNEDVVNFVIGEIGVAGGVASDFVRTSAQVYTATITPTDAYTNVAIDVNAGAAQDSANNPNTAATQLIVPHAAPTAPRKFQAQAGDGQVALSWQAPTSPGASGPITRYQYQQNDGTGFGAWTDIAGGGGARSVNVGGLANGTSYSFRLRAVNGNSTDSPSAQAQAIPIVGAAVPGAPTNLSAIAGNSQMTLRWLAPANPGSSAIIKYQYRQQAAGALDFDAWVDIAGVTTRSFVIKGLINGIQYTFEVRAVNSQGGGASSSSASATPSASAATPQAKQRQQATQVTKTLTPEVSKVITSNLVSVLTDRLSDIGSGLRGFNLGNQSNVASLLKSHETAINNGEFELSQLLFNSGFSLSLEEESDSDLSIWGKGSYRDIAGGNTKRLKWDGRIESVSLGIDGYLDENTLMGVSVAASQARVEFTDYQSNAGKGDYKSDLSTISPYINWSWPKHSLWLMGSYGTGKIEQKLDQETVKRKADSRLTSVATGGRMAIYQEQDNIAKGSSRVDIKAQASADRFKVKGSRDINEVDTNSRQLRMSVEGSHLYPSSAVSQLESKVELGVRYDGGEGETGWGSELGLGVGYSNRLSGFAIELNTRRLLTHTGDLEEWGVDGTITLKPGAQGYGPSFMWSVTRGYEELGNRLLEADSLSSLSANTQGTNYRTEIGYGIALPLQTQTMLTPYTAIDLLSTGSKKYALGMRLNVEEDVQLSLEGSQHQTKTADDDKQMDLKLELNNW